MGVGTVPDLDSDSFSCDICSFLGNSFKPMMEKVFIAVMVFALLSILVLGDE